MSERFTDDDAHIRAKLLEYSASEQLLDRLDPTEARDLLRRIETIVAMHEKDLQHKVDGLSPAG
jgi:hypothetical protein